MGRGRARQDARAAVRALCTHARRGRTATPGNGRRLNDADPTCAFGRLAPTRCTRVQRGDLRWPRSRTNHVADLAGPLHCEIGSAVRGPPRDVQRSHCAVWCGSQPEALSSEARVWRVCDGLSAVGGWRTKTRQESADRARCTCVGHQTAWWATVEAVSCLDSTSACGSWRRRGRDCRLGRGGQSHGRPCRL